MKSRRLFWFSIVVLLFTGLLLVGFWDEPMEVETVMVDRGELALMIRVTGEVVNDRSVELTALMDGQVIAVDAGVGDRVKTGQILASMDNRAAAAKRQRALAYTRQQAMVRKEAKRRYQRLQKLAVKGAVTQEQLEDAELNWEAAAAAWEVAWAELRLTEVAQEWQQITAPFDAVVIEKSTEKGQWVEAGTKFFTLVALDQWEIEAHIDAVDSGRIRVGQKVTLRCDAFADKSWVSRVNWIGPNVEQEKDHHLNTFAVRLGLGDEAPSLLLGQQVDLEIEVARREEVLKLPFSALKERDGIFEVGVIVEGHLSYLPVEIGLEGDNHVELLSGIEEGRKVVLLEGTKYNKGISVREKATP